MYLAILGSLESAIGRVFMYVLGIAPDVVAPIILVGQLVRTIVLMAYDKLRHGKVHKATW